MRTLVVMDLAEQLIGNSAPMKALRATIERFLRGATRGMRPPPVLLQGDTGSGKGLVASILHQMSQRHDAPFVDVNCAAIPESLLEAELFGYERGAFTDARRSKPGLFQTANRGTLFLDEIALLPGTMQAKLLTALEERSVRRLGSTHKEPVDTWIVSASNLDLAAEARARRFREDLYHRLAVVTLRIPPLRERGDDVILLVQHFLARARADYGLPELTLEPEAQERLRTYAWPGNVRELANVVERAAVLADSNRITAAMLGLGGGQESRAPAGESGQKRHQRDETLRDRLQEVLAATRGNITRTAEILGVTRVTVRAQMRRFGLQADTAMPGPNRRARARVPLIGDRALAEEPSRAANAVVSSSAGHAPAARQSTLRWEYRRIAILKASLPSLPDTSSPYGGPLLQLILDKIGGFGGRVEELGPATVEAAFGVDVIEDAPRRAAHAALAIARQVARAPEKDGELLPRMSIHTGRVLVGRVADLIHIDRESSQPLLQLLSALHERARPGEILVSASAAASLERRFALAPPEGDRAASPASYLLTSRERSGLGLWGMHSRFVGRSEELAVLRTHAAKSAEGRGQVVALVGEAGVGKSRLLWEFARSVGTDWRVVEASCAGGGQTLYHLATELLKAFFHIGTDDSPAAIRAAVDAELASFDDSVRAGNPALLALLGVTPGDSRWERLHPPERRREMLESVMALLRSAARVQPLLLAVEDVHWVDAESRAVLDAILSNLAQERALVLLSCRPEGDDPWKGLGSCTRLSIQPLPIDEAMSLLEGLMGDDGELAALKQQMIHWTEGNPFFIEEMVRALVESGALVGERGTYRLTRPVATLDVPATVEEVLAARIHRLESDDRTLLQTAATIGAVAPVAILRTVTEMDEGTLRAGLRRLGAAGFLVERSSPGGMEIVFEHPLTLEVTRLSLLPDVKRDLHARVLASMESLYPDPLGEQVDRLAYHAVAGEVPDKAVVYSRQAGDRALRSFAMRKALESFRHAIGGLQRIGENPDTLIQVVDLHLRMRDALWPLGRLEEMFDVLRAGDALAARAGDPRRRGWIACYLAQYFWSIGENERALDAGTRARAIAVPLDDVALTAETNFYVGITQLALGNCREAAEMLRATAPILDRALETDESGFPSPRFALSGRALLRGWLARSLAELGEFREGLLVGREGLRIAEASDSPFGVIAAAAGLGLLHLRRGDVGEALPIMERALELCRTYGFQNWIPTVSAILGSIHARSGRLAEGMALLRHSAAVSERTHIAASAALWRIQLGEAYLVDEQWAESLDVAQQGLALSLARKERGHEARARLLLAEVEAHSERADPNAVERMYEIALALSDELGMRPLAAECHASLGRFHERAGRLSSAIHHRSRAAALAAELDLVTADRNASS